MQSQTKIKRHAALVDRMAKTLGVDIEEKVLNGQLDPNELVDAVLHCTLCSGPDDCDRWLLAQNTPTTQPPDYCQNARIFANLGKETRA